MRDPREVLRDAERAMLCTKCGSESGWEGPSYRSYWTRGVVGPHSFYPPQFSEWLSFACRTCGYERREEVKDKPKKLPPQKPDVFVPARRWWWPL